MAAKRESLWQKYLEDPSQWWDSRNSKLSTLSPEFKHKVTTHSLWCDGYTPPWVAQDQTRKQGLFDLRNDESPFNVVRLLKECTARKDLHEGSRLHAYIQGHNYLGKNAYVSSSLVSMYAKCGALAKAEQVLKELLIRDIVSWSALIAGYAEQGQGEKALKCFDEMLHEGHLPDAVTFACVLKACGSIRAAAKGEEIHETITNLGMLEKDIVLGNALVDMYVKCGTFGKAKQVLKELPFRDVVSWNSLIAGYAHQGQLKEALKCVQDMLCEGHPPDPITFICVLKACGSIGAAVSGKEIHDKIVSLGMLEKNIALGNSLVDMYVKCGELAKAQQVLEELPIRNVVSWSALIAGYAQMGQGEKALKCFDDMLREGHSPTAVTCACVLKACGNIGAVAKGEEIHHMIVNMGILEKDIVLATTLVDMYMNCGALAKAQQVAEEFPMHDMVSWSVLIAGYAQQGKGEEALKCFHAMVHEGHSPNVVTFICALKACGSIGSVVNGKKIHDKIVSLGILEKNIVLGTSLVAMYMKCNDYAKAQQVFKELPVCDVVSWSALIAGYAQKGQGEKALKCFDDMLREGHFPTAVTFFCVLKACGSIGAAAKGEEIHKMIVNMGMLEKDIVLGTSLVDMYMKCGALSKVQQVVKGLPMCDVVSWNALIAGYAHQGQGKEALKCLDDMLREGQCPNAVTFISLLKACANIGAMAKGEEVHEKVVSLGMLKKHVVLGNSLIDMYVKCGALAKVQQVLEELPIHDVIFWNALIAGYVQQGQGKRALKCFKDMLCEGHSPNAITFTCALKACGTLGAWSRVKQLGQGK